MLLSNFGTNRLSISTEETYTVGTRIFNIGIEKVGSFTYTGCVDHETVNATVIRAGDSAHVAIFLVHRHGVCPFNFFFCGETGGYNADRHQPFLI